METMFLRALRPQCDVLQPTIASDALGTCDQPGVGAGSVARKVHSEVVLLLGWGRAILMLLAHPLVACAIADHSTYQAHRLHRLHRTLDAMLALTFGTPEEVERVFRAVNVAHDRVNGKLRESAGIFPAGTEYSARDPALLRWVHATLLDSFLRTYELYVGSLAPGEKDRYCAETKGVESLLGIPAGYLPRSVTELQTYMDKMLASGEITVTETACNLAREIVSPAVLWPGQPLVWLMRLPTIGLLPPAIRQAYGFPWDSRHEAALHLSAELVRGLLPMTPSFLRHWHPGLNRTANRLFDPTNMSNWQSLR
jgi:uncharacterized protein (DUF2236 family)